MDPLTPSKPAEPTIPLFPFNPVTIIVNLSTVQFFMLGFTSEAIKSGSTNITD